MKNDSAEENGPRFSTKKFFCIKTVLIKLFKVPRKTCVAVSFSRKFTGF